MRSSLPRIASAVASLGILVASVFASFGQSSTISSDTKDVLTALRNDYIAACGCTGIQIGGLSNEANAIKELKARFPKSDFHFLDLGPSPLSLRTAGVFAEYFKRESYDYVLSDAPSPEVASGYDAMLSERGVNHLPPQFDSSRLLGIKGTPHFLLFIRPYDARRDSALVEKLRGLPEDSRVLIVEEHASDADVLFEGVPELRAHSKSFSRDSGDFGDKDPQFSLRPFPQRGEMLIVGIDATGGFKVTRMPVTTAIGEDPWTKELVMDYYEKLGAATKVAKSPPQRVALFTPAKTCGECHVPEYVQWRATKHAHAIETLVKAHREVDECLSCHSSAYRQTKAYDPSDYRINESVTCETCHGPGARHTYRQKAGDILRKPSASVCVTCHTKVQDPTFSFDTKVLKTYHLTLGHP